jgi:hypothetical protein
MVKTYNFIIKHILACVCVCVCEKGHNHGNNTQLCNCDQQLAETADLYQQMFDIHFLHLPITFQCYQF